MENVLELKGVNKIYGTSVKTQVLTDINIAFKENIIVIRKYMIMCII